MRPAFLTKTGEHETVLSVISQPETGKLHVFTFDVTGVFGVNVCSRMRITVCRYVIIHIVQGCSLSLSVSLCLSLSPPLSLFSWHGRNIIYVPFSSYCSTVIRVWCCVLCFAQIRPMLLDWALKSNCLSVSVSIPTTSPPTLSLSLSLSLSFFLSAL